jgi:hypothetical protein
MTAVVLFTIGMTSCIFSVLFFVFFLLNWWYLLPRNVRKMHRGMPAGELDIDDDGVSEIATAGIPGSRLTRRWREIILAAVPG